MDYLSTTPGRETRIHLDRDFSAIYKAPWGLVLNGAAIGTASNSIHHTDAMGWTLRSSSLLSSNLHELTQNDSTVIKSTADGGTLLTAPGVVSRYAHRVPTELTGITSGLSSKVASQSDYMLCATVPATANWATYNNLSAQQLAYPGIDTPTTGTTIEQTPDWNYRLLRVAQDTLQSKGFQPFSFKFLVTGTKLKQKDVIFVLYFCGPPSKEWLWTGTGRSSGITAKAIGALTLNGRVDEDSQELEYITENISPRDAFNSNPVPIEVTSRFTITEIAQAWALPTASGQVVGYGNMLEKAARESDVFLINIAMLNPALDDDLFQWAAYVRLIRHGRSSPKGKNTYTASFETILVFDTSTGAFLNNPSLS